MANENEVLSNRLQGLRKIFSADKPWLFAVLLLIIIIISTSIRVSNVPNLHGTLMGLDPYLFYRYAEDIVKTGTLPKIDYMRAYPVGYPTGDENTLLSYIEADTYKVLHYLVPTITLLDIAIYYPAIAFAISMVFFYLFVFKLFNNRWLAILASAILAFHQSYLFRTIAGFADKDALGMLFFFSSFYLFLEAMDHKNKLWKYVGVAALAGISTGLLSLSWGGSVMIFFIVGAAMLVRFMFNFEKKEYIVFSIWFGLSILIMLGSLTKYGGLTMGGIKDLFAQPASLIAIVALAYGAVLLAMNRYKQNIEQKVPYAVACIGLTVIIGTVGFLGLVGVDKVSSIFQGFYEMAIAPFQTARHTLTVAENAQPYFAEWTSFFGQWVLWLFLGGAVLVFYELVSNLKYKWKLTAVFVFAVFGFAMTRYAQDSILNGTNGLSVLLYLGSALLFAAMIFGGYWLVSLKDKETYAQLKSLKFGYIFAIMWFLLMLVAGRGAVRMFFVIVPVAAVMAAFAFIFVIYKLPNDWFYKLIPAFAAVCLVISLWSVTARAAPAYGGESPQWVTAMDWVDKNTPTDAVFAHWWDYGYLVQSLGHRATVLDGGQPVGSWNYLMGRHVLTGRSEQEALEFLYAHNVSYLLIDPTDIGKYKAYAFIGSDKNYDRDTSISTFGLAAAANNTYIWSGPAPLPEQFTWEGRIYTPNDLVYGVQVEIANGTVVSQPELYMSQTVKVPLQCIYVNNKEYRWQTGYPGCGVIIPNAANQQIVHPYGNLIFLNSKAEPSLMTKLYIRNYNSTYFTQVYADQTPLVVYNGQIIGPIKIWKVTYPSDIKFKPEYLQIEFPADVFWS